jgi:hypothetical protein
LKAFQGDSGHSGEQARKGTESGRSSLALLLVHLLREGLLHRSGWSIGDAAFHDGAGGLLWLVSGANGENLIRAEGSTRSEAWGRALDQARGLGMLGDHPGGR